ncbi:hypothetical protein [uncultured Chitinophaga sp.]|uniref:hypothetical protein n=1 Tax=uncultured Chitinophaga sp. TaxID=339340 RepID=UPI0025EF82C3|nr:hypothetical protein [uncultured Chitinophaga sp.]
MKENSFPYNYRLKALGILIMLAGVFSFFQQYIRKDVFDANELAVGLSWGLVFFFFSKEKRDDEMIHILKFKALTRAVIISFAITHLYNYLMLNWRLEREKDIILSISAYQFLALTLLIATGIFYYMKHQASLIEEK